MHRSPGSWLLGIVALVAPLTVSSHHSVAFYANEKIELAGEITEIDWQNPHIQFALRTVGGDGAEKTWRLESSSIFLREKDGVTRDLFRVGDKVTVAGRPSAHDATALLVTNMLLPDGREAPLWPNTTARFVGADKWINAKPQLVDAAAENRGIFRVWRPNGVSLAALPYTDAAVAARKSFDLLAAATRCGPEGMPRIMITLFPYEFVDRGNAITLRSELYDTERTIHMDRTAPPPGEPHSILGYSVGEWRDGELFVKTTLVNWPYFDQSGTPLSDRVTVAERYQLSDDQTRLDLELTVVDPSTFEKPAIIRNSWLAYGDTIRRYDCQEQ
jgi:hypothetical protein